MHPKEIVYGVWQYGLSSYHAGGLGAGGTESERFLPKKQHTKTLLNFENWCNGEVSKLGIFLENEVISKYTDVPFSEKYLALD